MQTYLSRAAEELGLRISIAHQVALRNGGRVTSQAFFPGFGSGLGILIFCSSDKITNEIRKELNEMGYGITTYAAPSLREAFDIRDYIDMFSEWGWVGEPQNRPAWIAKVKK